MGQGMKRADLKCQEVEGVLHQGLRVCSCGPVFLVEVVFNEDTKYPTFQYLGQAARRESAPLGGRLGDCARY